MAKFKFGERPETVSHTVRWQDWQGKQVTLKVEFNWRSRSEFAALMDELGVTQEGRSEGDKLQEIIEAVDGKGAALLVAALASWELDDELNLENCQRLFDEYQAAAHAIVEAYRQLCLEGRLGN